MKLILVVFLFASIGLQAQRSPLMPRVVDFVAIRIDNIEQVENPYDTVWRFEFDDSVLRICYIVNDSVVCKSISTQQPAISSDSDVLIIRYVAGEQFYYIIFDSEKRVIDGLMEGDYYSPDRVFLCIKQNSPPKKVATYKDML